MRLLRLHFVQARNDKREISFRFTMTGGDFDQSFKETEKEIVCIDKESFIIILLRV